MTRLEARGLTRRPWFEGRDLVLEPGEIVVLRGPNGSGKTLFLRALADLDPVDAGHVTLDGVARKAMRPEDWRRRVVYVHQSTPRVGASVREDLARIAGLQVHAGRTAPLAIAPPEGIDVDAASTTLSGGEAQRVALARALALEPDVLLLDETTSQLDGDAARAAERQIADFAQAGGAVVWVAHDAEIASRNGARVEVFP